MKILKSKYWVLLVLFLVSAAFISPYFKQGFIIASGESPLYIDASYLNYYSMWTDKFNFGSPSMVYYSNIFLYSIFWSILNVFSFIIHPSILFIFLSPFLAGLFFYLCLDQILKFKNKLIYLPPVLLYSFNVFRVVNVLNERLHLLFIFLPLFFLFYYKLVQTKKWKYVFIIVILSILASPLGANLPVFTIPYILIALYGIYYLFTSIGKQDIKKFLLQNGVLVSLIIISNLFWMIPGAQYLLGVYNQTQGGTELFTSLSSGNLFDYFRFIGFWAWKSTHYLRMYQPYAYNYDKPPLLFTTFLVSFSSFIYLLFLKIKKQNSLKIFILGLSLVAYFLLEGTNGSFGFIYKFIYLHFSLFRMYRDPFAKFTPLLIFACAWGLAFSLLYLTRLVKRKITIGLIALLSMMIIINAYPLFDKEAISIREWNGEQWGSFIKIPDYWGEAKKFIENDTVDRHLTLFPFHMYGTSHNWEFGTNVTGDMADFLINKNMIRGWDTDDSSAGLIMKNIFKQEGQKFNLKNYLSLLNTKYILQVNEAEWRYVNHQIAPPSQSNQFLQEQGLEKVAEFGKFTADYLSKIPNDEPKEALRNELNQELLNQAALVLYQLPDQYFLPHLYVPQKIIKTREEPTVLPQIVSEPDYQIRCAVYFENQNEPNNQIVPTVVNQPPVLEFKKITANKYRLRIHQARESFPLIFSESFHRNWQIYFGDYPLEEKNNFDLNGYEILTGNQESQATPETLKEFAEQGLVTAIDTKEKSKKHQTYKDGTKKVDWVEKYKIDFVSKNFRGTIQNDNLPRGKFYETWFARPLATEGEHLVANGFANSWILDPQKICRDHAENCVQNNDGSFDFEVVIAFKSQKMFIILFTLALIILFASLIFICYVQFSRKNQREN